MKYTKEDLDYLCYRGVGSNVDINGFRMPFGHLMNVWSIVPVDEGNIRVVFRVFGGKDYSAIIKVMSQREFETTVTGPCFTLLMYRKLYLWIRKLLGLGAPKIWHRFWKRKKDLEDSILMEGYEDA